MVKVHDGPSLTVDGILVKDGRMLLIRRGADPFRRSLALPGGFVELGETVEKAVVREMEEETGIRTVVTELLGVYSAVDRDPRRHTVSAVFVLSETGGELSAGDDAEAAVWVDLNDIPELAFDHNRIVSDYIDKNRKGEMIY